MRHEVNLLPKIDRSSSGRTFLIVGVAGAWLAVAGMLGALYYTESNEEATLRTLEQQLNTELLAVTQPAAASGSVSLEQAAGFAQSVTVETSPILQELSAQLPMNAYLTGYTLNESTASVENQFETMNDLSEYIVRLESSEPFSDVKVLDVETYTYEEEITEEYFTVIPRYRSVIEVTIDREQLRVKEAENE